MQSGLHDTKIIFLIFYHLDLTCLLEDNTWLKPPCRGRTGSSERNHSFKQSSHSQSPTSCQPSGTPLHKHILEYIK